ncbi:MAG: T9SS type A sorting domain-containing protein [Bacteroidota bacterium]
MKRIKAISIILAVTSSSLVAQSFQKPPAQQPSLLHKSAQTKNNAILNINNFTYWVTASGQGAQPPNQAYNGTSFPRGTSHPIFADGFIWGGKCYLDAARTQRAPIQLIRVGGNTYNVGNAVGWINGTGANAVAVSTSDPRARIYRVRRDYAVMSTDDLKRDAMENNLFSKLSDVTQAHIDAVVAQYAQDWDSWPVDLGAPYIERNGTPEYQKPPPFSSVFTVDSLIAGCYDEPGVAGSDPNSPADQVIWTVFNDLTRGNMISFMGCEPMGIEGQLTVWGYKARGFLENTFFKRLRLINKGGAVVNAATGAKGSVYIDSLYIQQWSDEDLGNAGDDLVGCDSVLSLAFVYNSMSEDEDYSRFNIPPPSMGYDLLAGPRKAESTSDSAFFDFRWKRGMANVPMSSFCWFAAGNPLGQGACSEFSYECALEWWKLFRGFRQTSSVSADSYYPRPPGDPPTFFTLAGDPVSGTGSLDGLGIAYSPQPGDRRTLSNSGPVLFAPGDTQEVYVGIVGGLGSDRLSSVAVMKANDRALQGVFDAQFQCPTAPVNPSVIATGLDGAIILEWNNREFAAATEANRISIGNYEFEGYNIYQLSSPNISTSKRTLLATFDRVDGVRSIVDTQYDNQSRRYLPYVIQRGTDSGIRRSLHIARDAFRDGKPLSNGTEYYFAVTAYNHATDGPWPPSLESPIVPIPVKPGLPFGVTALGQYGDTVRVSHRSGLGSGPITVRTINPLQGNGMTYEVRFDSLGGATTWSLRNLTVGQLLLTGQLFHADADDAPAVEGGVTLSVEPPNGPGDVYSYSPPSLQTGPEVQKASAQRINVFPNPYYADQAQRGANFRSLVTFTSLPQRATIRIFNLAGHLVRTLRKDDASQYFDWDLTNEENWQVGSGIYLCYIEMPDIGEKKFLKLAVIQGQTYPKVY